MEQEIFTIKKELEDILLGVGSFTFSEKFGKRRENKFRIGELSFKEQTVIFESEKYLLFGDEIEEDKKNKIKEIMKDSSF